MRTDLLGDIGAYTGYFWQRVAPAVMPNGKVETVDVQPKMNSLLKATAQRSGLTQIETRFKTAADVRPFLITLSKQCKTKQSGAQAGKHLGMILMQNEAGRRLAYQACCAGSNSSPSCCPSAGAANGSAPGVRPKMMGCLTPR